MYTWHLNKFIIIIIVIIIIVQVFLEDKVWYSPGLPGLVHCHPWTCASPHRSSTFLLLRTKTDAHHPSVCTYEKSVYFKWTGTHPSIQTCVHKVHAMAKCVTFGQQQQKNMKKKQNASTCIILCAKWQTFKKPKTKICTIYQRKVNVDMLNAVKSVLADVSSVSPSSEQRGDDGSPIIVDTLYVLPSCWCRPKLVLTGTSIPF